MTLMNYRSNGRKIYDVVTNQHLNWKQDIKEKEIFFCFACNMASWQSYSLISMYNATVVSLKEGIEKITATESKKTRIEQNPVLNGIIPCQRPTFLRNYMDVECIFRLTTKIGNREKKAT